jgi:hypothetical protein
MRTQELKEELEKAILALRDDIEQPAPWNLTLNQLLFRSNPAGMPEVPTTGNRILETGIRPSSHA